MAGVSEEGLRAQLLKRRQRLHQAAPANGSSDVARLLSEVDAALERMERGTYGMCETCHEPVEAERLMIDPLTRFCLDHLTSEQQRALEYDLELAATIQKGLLPRQNTRHAGWQVCYHYQPLGLVSGDYCDVLAAGDGQPSVLVLLGDVSGKGVAASMLMSHLNAMYRSLNGFNMPVCEMMERANRLFCESTLASHFATLVCMRASGSGEVEICNAGHCPVALICGGELKMLEASELPLGMFATSRFSSQTVHVTSGDSILIYTDGLSEARADGGSDYAEARLKKFLSARHSADPAELILDWVADVKDFCASKPLTDDLTAMVVRRL